MPLRRTGRWADCLPCRQCLPTTLRSRWVGTSSELLEGLLEHTGGRTGGDRHWPRCPQQLGQRLRRLGVNLRRGGFEIRYWREGKQSTRMVSIRKVG